MNKKEIAKQLVGSIKGDYISSDDIKEERLSKR